MADSITHSDPVFAIVASPAFTEDRTCYAACATGVYRSCDGGESWQYAYDALDLQSDLLTSALAVSPDFARDQIVLAGSSGGILRSCDAGQTWQVITLPTPPSIVSCLVFSPQCAGDGVVFLATTDDGVYRSSDRGQTWARWNFGLFDLHVLALVASPDLGRDDTLFAGTETGIYVSSNGGRSWRPVPFPDNAAPVLSLAPSPGFARDGTLYAGTDSEGLWVSMDRGQSWIRVAADVLAGAVNAIVLGTGDVQPAHFGSLLALTDEGAVVTRDGGASWVSMATAFPADATPTAIAAPAGLLPGAALLLGLDDGRVVVLG